MTNAYVSRLPALVYKLNILLLYGDGVARLQSFLERSIIRIA